MTQRKTPVMNMQAPCFPSYTSSLEVSTAKWTTTVCPAGLQNHTSQRASRALRLRVVSNAWDGELPQGASKSGHHSYAHGCPQGTSSSVTNGNSKNAHKSCIKSTKGPSDSQLAKASIQVNISASLDRDNADASNEVLSPAL